MRYYGLFAGVSFSLPIPREIGRIIMASVEITFTDEKPALNEFLFYFFETDSIDAGMTKTIPGVAEIALQPIPLRKSMGAGEFTILVSFATSVASRLFADWISKKLKARPTTKVKIGRTEVH